MFPDDPDESLQTSAILTPEHTPTKDHSKNSPSSNEDSQPASHESTVDDADDKPDTDEVCNGNRQHPRRTCKVPLSYCEGSDGEQDASSSSSEDSASTTVIKAKVTKSEQAAPRSRKGRGKAKTAKTAGNKTTTKPASSSTNAKKTVK